MQKVNIVKCNYSVFCVVNAHNVYTQNHACMAHKILQFYVSTCDIKMWNNWSLNMM